jgi:DNA-binding NarL/FixJ family response regulator
VLVVDDDNLMRAGLTMIIEQTSDVSVVGEAEDGRQGVLAARRELPDVVLMDVRMPVVDGIEATREIVSLPNPPRVLILTTFELDAYVFNALDAGASGFLLKRTPPEQLIEGIRTVAAGDALLSPSVTKRLIAEFARRPVERELSPLLAELTDREREVLVAMARGLSNAELAEELYISENTVKTHVSRVLTKLGARDRVNAVVMAYQGGLMEG